MFESPTPSYGSWRRPGSSFVDLLRDVAPENLPGAGLGTTAAVPIEIVHGTTVLAIRYDGGVVMAGDRRATAGYTIANRRVEKVFAADALSGVAIAGAAGPAVELVKLFQVQLEHYEKIEGEILSLEGKANQLGQLVRANLPAAHAGLRGGAALRGLRRASRPWSRLQLRRHRRQVRGSRLPDQRLGRRPRPQLDQGHVARRHHPRRSDRPRAAVALRRRRRGHRDRRPRHGAPHLPDRRGDLGRRISRAVPEETVAAHAEAQLGGREEGAGL